MSSNTSEQDVAIFNKSNGSFSAETGTPTQRDNANAVFTFVYVFLWVLTAGGNMLVVLCVAKEAKLRSSSNVLIAHVACSDFLYSFIILSTIIEMHQHTSVTCGFIAWFGIVLFMTSVHSQLLVSVNRYVLVAKSTHIYRKLFQRKVVVCAIICIWLLDFVYYGLVPASEGDWKTFHLPTLHICIFYSPSFDLAMHIAIMSSVSFVVAFICYLKLLIYVKKNMMSIGSSKRKEVKASTVLFVVLFLFFVTYTILPAIITVNRESGVDLTWQYFISKFTLALHWSNFSLNPILYGLRIQDFKTAYKKLLFPCKQKIQPLPSITE